jgi:maltooligosyltrehalose trehalohydrolase
MHTYRVWAPSHDVVEVVSGGRRLRLEAAGRGWWAATDPQAGPGTRYGFSLDGGDARPDPRSGSQPDGVLALSEVIDQASHRWRDAGWTGMPLAGSTIYELHVGTFSPEGTFDGAAKRLPHLVGLGVRMVELMPVAEFSGERGWGYDGVDLFAPHHAYGGPAALKRLVDACHAAGLGVVLDVVYNHLGPAGNFLSEFGPYFSDRHHTDWGAALNFDGAGSDEVRRLVIDNALMWIRDYHFDGLRLDAVHAIVDQSPVHVLEQLAVEVRELAEQLGRSAILIAESDLNDPRLVRPRAAGGYGLDAMWADDWHHALHAVLTGESAGYYEDFGSLDALGKALRQAWVYDGEWSPHRQRTRGRKADGIALESFVVAAQNHDQVGNRATGERLARLVGEARLKIAAALLLTSPFTAMLFQGEEWACGSPFLYFTDHADTDLAAAVRDGRRREFEAFGWKPADIPDPQARATFERSRLDWDELDQPLHARMLEWHRALIRLRASLPAVQPGGWRVEVEGEGGRLTARRGGISVCVNLGVTEWRMAPAPGARVVLASEPGIAGGGEGIRLPPSSVAIVEDASAGA